MAQLSHPAGDLSVGFWSDEAGTIINLYSSIGSPLNDATYVQSADPPTDDYAKFIFAPLSVPQAGDIKLKIRAKWGSGKVGTFFQWAAVVGATSYVLDIGTVSGGPYTTYSQDVGNVLTKEVVLAPGTYYSRVVPQGAGSPTAEQTTVVT